MSTTDKPKPKKAWEVLGVSRATWYRRHRRHDRPETTETSETLRPPQAPAQDRVVSLGERYNELLKQGNVVGPRFSDEILARLRVRRRRSSDWISPFEVNLLARPPSVNKPTMAMDQSVQAMITWAGTSGMLSSAVYGYADLAHPGYAVLAEMGLVAEYRRAAEVLSTEMTRKWIKLVVTGDDDKTEKLKQLDNELKRLNAQHVFHRLAMHDALFGVGHLLIDIGPSPDRTPAVLMDRDELITPIGNGCDEISKLKMKPGWLQRIDTIEPLWVSPMHYSAINPAARDFYRASSWLVNGVEYDVSRLLQVISYEVPDAFKPAFQFGGQPLTLMMRPYVERWLRAVQSVNDLIHSFSVMGLKTDLSASLNAEGDELVRRADAFTSMRDNQGLLVLNKDTEDFFIASAQLASLDKLQAQAQEHLCAVCGIPVLILFGLSPTGLNATAEPELIAFYGWVHARQEKIFRPALTTVINFAQLSLWGEVYPEIDFVFEPLWVLDENQLATVRKTEAETAQIYIDSGVVSQGEVRQVIASDPDTPYAGLDVEELPDLKQEEEEGLQPVGGRPNPLADSEQPDDGEKSDEEDRDD
jgi:phage-related protein (TIGR01555 family)